MSDENQKSAATVFLDVHPEFRTAMATSRTFQEIKARATLNVDKETLYIVRGDTLGNEDDLYLDALARGAGSTVDDVYRQLFLELDEASRALIEGRAGVRRPPP